MIFVTVGSSQFRFDRLIKSVDQLIKEGLIREDVFFQIGLNEPPKNGKWERFISFGEMEKRIQESRLVIGHAGIATILLCRRMGKVPIVMPREKRFREVVDDHQGEFIEKVEQEGWVRSVRDVEELRKVLIQAASWNPPSLSQEFPQGKLAKFLIAQV